MGCRVFRTPFREGVAKRHPDSPVAKTMSIHVYQQVDTEKVLDWAYSCPSMSVSQNPPIPSQWDLQQAHYYSYLLIKDSTCTCRLTMKSDMYSMPCGRYSLLCLASGKIRQIWQFLDWGNYYQVHTCFSSILLGYTCIRITAKCVSVVLWNVR